MNSVSQLVCQGCHVFCIALVAGQHPGVRSGALLHKMPVALSLADPRYQYGPGQRHGAPVVQNGGQILKESSTIRSPSKRVTLVRLRHRRIDIITPDGIRHPAILLSTEKALEESAFLLQTTSSVSTTSSGMSCQDFWQRWVYIVAQPNVLVAPIADDGLIDLPQDGTSRHTLIQFW